MPPLIVANWKCNPTTLEGAKELFSDYGKLIDKKDNVVVCPPFVYLTEVLPRGHEGGFSIGAQDCFYEEKGAYTGEISSLMLKDLGCQYVIIGHSERRQLFGETDATVNRKIHGALRAGLFGIVCIGETLAEREHGETMDVITRQLQSGLEGIAETDFQSVVIAYEPVWAIGTGKTATPDQAEEVHAHIRQKLSLKYGIGAAECAIILYGGSVKPANSFALLSEKNIDGFLVGGASLVAESFIEITKEAIRAYRKKR